MRPLLVLLCLTILGPPLLAQEQERKLVDRLLRPDLSLSNPAQNKRFSGTDATPVHREFLAKPFYAGREYSAQRYSGLIDFLAKKFGTRSFAETTPAHVTAAPNDAKPMFRIGQSPAVRTSADENKSAPVREYADERPFRGKGTRQEILDQQSHPLTIEEVRELLNKDR